MTKKTETQKTETETTSIEATAPGIDVTKRPLLVPKIGAAIDAQLAADLDQDVVDDGGWGRRSTIAIPLLRVDSPKILAWLDRYLAEMKEADVRDELTKLRAYFADRVGALETLVPQHTTSTAGTVHYSDEAWAATSAGEPVAEAARKVALKRLKDQPTLRDQFSPGVNLGRSPEVLFDAVTQMLIALQVPEKQALYRRKRIRAARLAAQLTTVQVRLRVALAAGVTDDPRTGEVSDAIGAVLLQIGACAEHIETEFTQELRPDLADAFETQIPRHHVISKTDTQQGGGNNPTPPNPPHDPPPTPPAQSESTEKKP